VNISLASDGRNLKNAGNDDAACAEPAIQPWQLPPWSAPRRRNSCPIPPDKPNEGDCERQATQDEATCQSILNRYGAYRAQRCFASANLRYGNCKAGRWNFPNLDTGEY
jgi:hypothetical protein